jgi:hypothetical protein
MATEQKIIKDKLGLLRSWVIGSAPYVSLGHVGPAAALASALGQPASVI